MNQEKERNNFTGTLGFVLASAASAIGLGNIWRFPFLAARDGGGFQLTPSINVDAILQKVNELYSAQTDVVVTTIDGVKIDFSENWVHLRKSNTEPIIRIYTEAKSQQLADNLAVEMIQKIEEIIKNGQENS